MLLLRTIGKLLIALILLGPIFASSAHADPIPMVTYSWTTTNDFNGPEPTSATFQAPLSDVQAGKIPTLDITNIQIAYPGLTLDGGTAASNGGSDFGAYVNPTTGALIYHDSQQGLAVVSYGTYPNGTTDTTTYVSISVDQVDPTTSNSVLDMYGALNNGSQDSNSGYLNNTFVNAYGYWTASIPAGPTTPVPVPASIYFLATGLGALGLVRWRRKKKTATLAGA